ncbi:MAG: hypothetical protein ACRDMV_14335, partial [Streptosporangiales bacterium]
VLGAVIALCSFGLLAAGGAAAAAATNGGGYINLGATGPYRTAAYALVSDSSNPTTELFGLVGTKRIRITPSNGSAPVFVGLAKPADVRDYLAGARYTTVHRATANGNATTAHDGKAPAKRPAEAGIWTVRTSGSGAQTLVYDADQQDGDRTLVAMNADGSRDVGGRVQVEASVPSLPWIATAALVVGAALLAAGALLVVRPVQRARGGRRRLIG